MPHVVVEGSVDLDRLFESFELLNTVEGADVRKTTDLYKSRLGHAVLIESLVVEHGRRQVFIVTVSRKGEGVTVRLLPLTDPDKTPGVLRLLAEIAREVRRCCPGTSFGKTNLQEYLDL